ncbi:hypothetical protein B0A55_10019 [Friedmanniomyces simplex]|uniref:G domain-containing protein n=1 Tax=Friedmanniomyces simplex TaxID=329884 RepID=A0A4V5NEU9_9PEZI|nr:hypothetical protein B0A55_10019 [Friedmanniomyces simplex]
MTSPRGVLAFTPKGYCIEKKDGKLKCQQIPKALAAELKTAQTIFCIAIGSNLNFFCAWKGTDGRPWIWRSLDEYPELEKAYEKGNEEWLKSGDFTKFHCSLGQNGSYYFNNKLSTAAKVGQSRDGLDVRLGKEITRRLEDQRFAQDPQQVALGIGGSYVLVGKNGDIFWDLKDHYADLETILQEAKSGVEHAVLSPFNDRNAEDVVIAIMGPTGAGKSTFIKRVTGQTLECKAYSFCEAETNFCLVDTPGFNDTYLDDAAILAQLAAFLESSYKAEVKLSAIVYMHPIVSHRLEGSALNNLAMFRKLCGSDFYPNVILATSFWGLVEAATGHRREVELRENDEFWGAMVKRGSQIVRLPDDREGSVQLLSQLAKKQRTTLQIQRELVDQGLSIHDTEAGAGSKNTQALEALRKEFSDRIATLAGERDAEMRRREAEFAKLRAEQDEAFEAGLRKHREDMEVMKAKHEALLREQAEKREKAMKEQEELLRKQQLETEKVRAELERMAVEEEKALAARRQLEKAQNSKKQSLQVRASQESQMKLYQKAIKAGTVKAKVSQEWNWWMERLCDHCGYSCGAGVSYSKPSLVTRPSKIAV